MTIPRAKNLPKNTFTNFNLDVPSDEREQIFPHEIKLENKTALSPIKILIVEDTLICQKITLHMLKKPDYFAELAITGEEALAKYKQGYDVILLDLGLPDIAGIDICRRIRQEIGDTTTPIIAYSTLSNSLRKECFLAGFTEVLTKPCSFEQLHGVIKQLVS